MTTETTAPQLSDAEKASLAKAEAHGVNVVQKDGTTASITDNKPAPPANATADVTPPATTTPTGDKPSRPEWCPEKFWNAETGIVNQEALARSYGELERTRNRPQETPQAPKMGDKPAEGTPPVDPNKPAETPPPAKTPEQVAAEAETARTSAVTAASADIAKDGKISDATYEALAKSGYTRSVVDEYVQGQQAVAQLQLNTIYESAGGKPEFDKMVAWGGASYTAEEQNAFNAALQSRDVGQQRLAVAGLKARFTAEFGRGATSKVDTKPSSSGSNAFKSQSEMLTAMNDPRYHKDSAYRNEIAERIAASTRAGIDIGLNVM